MVSFGGDGVGVGVGAGMVSFGRDGVGGDGELWVFWGFLRGGRGRIGVKIFFDLL